MVSLSRRGCGWGDRKGKKVGNQWVRCLNLGFVGTSWGLCGGGVHLSESLK